MNKTLLRSQERSRVPEICVAITIGIALLALIGWMSGMRFLAGGWGIYVPMAPSTALAFLLLSGALFSFAHLTVSRLSRFFALTTVGIVFLLGLLVLVQFTFNIDLGVEQALFRTNELLGSTPLGRMSPLTAVAFLLESAAFFNLLIAERRRNALIVAALFAAGATGINTVVLIGYIFGAPLLYGGTIIPVALPTAIAFMSVGMGQFYLAAPGIPMLHKWSRASMRGILLRAFLPVMLLFVLMDDWVDTKFQPILSLTPAVWYSLKVLAAGVLIVVITGWIARRTGGDIERAQKMLAESEVKHRMILNGMDEIVYQVNYLEDSSAASGIVEFVSERTREVLGYQPTDFMADPNRWFNLIHPEDISMVQSQTASIMKTGQPGLRHYRMKDINGQYRWMEDRVSPQKDKKGRVVRIFGVVRDITERKQAEEEVKLSNRRFQVLIENSADAITLLDPNGIVVYDSPAAPGMLGYGSDELIGQNAFTLMHPDDLPKIQDQFQNLLKTPDSHISILFRLRHKNGTWLWIEAIATNLLAEPSVKAIVVNYRDITERKRAEHAVRDSQLQLESILHSAMDAIIVVDEDQRIVIFNPAAEHMFKCGAGEAVGHSILRFMPKNNRADHAKFVRDFGETGVTKRSMETSALELTCLRADGEVFPSEISIAHIELGGRKLYSAIVRDITERKRAEETLRNAETRYRVLFEQSPYGIVLIDVGTGKVVEANDTAHKQLGYTREEFAALRISDYEMLEDTEEIASRMQKIIREGSDDFETLHRTKSGEIRNVHVFVKTLPLSDVSLFYAIYQDITEIKQAQNVVRSSEERFRALIENASDMIMTITVEGNLSYISPAVQRISGFQVEEVLGRNIVEFIHPDDIPLALESLASRSQISGLAPAPIELRFRHKNGAWRIVEILGNNLVDHPAVSAIVLNVRDITERKQAEDTLRESEEKYRMLAEDINEHIYRADPQTFAATYVNKAVERFYGYGVDEWLLDPSLWENAIFPEDRERVMEVISNARKTGQSGVVEYRIVSKQGKTRWVIDRFSSHKDAKGKLISFNGVVSDITESKQAEEELRSSRGFLQSVQDALSSHIAILDDQGNIVQVNSAWRDFGEQNGLSHSNHCIGMNYLDVCDSAKGLHAEEASSVANAIRVVLSGREDEIQIEYPCHAPDKQRWFVARITRFENKNRMWIVAAHLDITERKQAEERIRQQLAHLTALSAIDRVIASNYDLRLSLSEILTHVTNELGVDATDILLSNPSSQMLEYGAERGFRTKKVRKAQVRLGESYAGRVALERQLIQIPNLRDEPDNLLLTTHLAGEDFVCYYGLPLIAKGEVKGVLEVFHRSELEPDGEWFDFFNVLAGQAAIAIENVMLFDSLQRSNLELSMAYDATIEGWSRALDLRDKETEGHTQRVTEMTVKIARDFGLSEAELVQVRWGALLHDIGKMGVPDGILLKPGPLTEEEWVVMRKHPRFAYEMLAPIRYLRNALDIPYCHHEKWDGTGYPRQLKGDQIPLTARIFAIVDVWDALMSDRPYRPAWAREKVLGHILALSGTHFDPQVVDLFLRTMD